MDVKNKTILITGAGGGIGSALATRLSKEGAFLILTDKDQKSLDMLQKKLKSKKHIFIPCDMSNFSKVEKFIGLVSHDFLKIDFVFNVAGIGIYKPIKELPVKDWINSFNINVNAPFIIMKYLLPSMAYHGGWVFNIGSGMGITGTSNRVAYCASKFALRGMSLSLSREYENTNVSVSLITLGSVMDSFGTGGIEERRRLQEKGKNYLSIETVIDKIMELIKSNLRLKELTLYPEGYA